MPNSLNWRESHQLLVLCLCGHMDFSKVCNKPAPCFSELSACSNICAYICCSFPLLQEGAHLASLQFLLRRSRAVHSFTVTGTSFLLKLLEIYLFRICSSTRSRSSNQLKAICELQVTAGLCWLAKNIVSVWSLFHLLFEVCAALYFLMRCDSHSWMTFISSCARSHTAPCFVSLKAFAARVFTILCAVAVNIVNLGAFCSKARGWPCRGWVEKPMFVTLGTERNCVTLCSHGILCLFIFIKIFIIFIYK